MKGLTVNNNRFSKRNTYSEASHPEEVEPLFEEGTYRPACACPLNLPPLRVLIRRRAHRYEQQ